MGQKSIPAPVVAAVIAVVAILVIVFLYKGITGGQVTEGKPGSIVAAPPMSEAAKQQMMQQAQKQ